MRTLLVSIAVILVVAAAWEYLFLNSKEAPIFSGTSLQETTTQPMAKVKPQIVTLKTVDDKDIAADYYPANPPAGAPKGAIVYVHMMPATKESWKELAAEFASMGYVGLAIDLRGHGESTGGPNGFLKFSDAEHQKSILDLDAAVKYLVNGGFAEDKVVFVGASIGANLSLKYIADNPAYKTAVLLSPGVNYKGIETLPLAAKLNPDQKVFLIGAKDDGRNLGNMASQITTISENIPAGVEKQLKIYDTGGHGTDLLSAHEELSDLIFDFISK